MTAIAPRWGVVTDTGTQRELNEDFAIVRVFPTAAGTTRDDVVVAVVADGMGGHASGEIASLMAADTVLDVIGERLPRHPLDLASLKRHVAIAVKAANSRIYQRGRSHTASLGMGTTLTIALVWKTHLLIGHVGDSRAYLIHDGSVEQLTEDHTVVAAKVKAGLLTPAEAAISDERNQLLKAVGTDAEMNADVVSRRLQPGETLLLASDGAYSSLGEEDFTHAVASNGTPKAVCKDLVTRARIRDGSDNITVICLQMGPALRMIGKKPPSRQWPLNLLGSAGIRPAQRPLVALLLLTVMLAISVTVALAWLGGGPPGEGSAGVMADITVPDVTGRSISNAEEILENAKLRSEVHSSPPDPKNDYNVLVVVRQKPDSGTKTTAFRPVRLEAELRVKVPRLVGLSTGEARKSLAERGLRMRKNDGTREGSGGVVEAQDPDPGKLVRKKRTIDVTVTRAAKLIDGKPDRAQGGNGRKWFSGGSGVNRPGPKPSSKTPAAPTTKPPEPKPSGTVTTEDAFNKVGVDAL